MGIMRQIGQQVRIHQRERGRCYHALVIIAAAHFEHPPGTVEARGAEEPVDVVAVDGIFREGGAEKVGDGEVGPLRFFDAEEADEGEQGGGAIEDEFGHILRRRSGRLPNLIQLICYIFHEHSSSGRHDGRCGCSTV